MRTANEILKMKFNTMDIPRPLIYMFDKYGMSDVNDLIFYNVKKKNKIACDCQTKFSDLRLPQALIDILKEHQLYFVEEFNIFRFSPTELFDYLELRSYNDVKVFRSWVEYMVYAGINFEEGRDKFLYQLNLPVRVENALFRKWPDLIRLSDFQSYDEAALLEVRNIGDKSLTLIKEALKKSGYCLKQI